MSQCQQRGMDCLDGCQSLGEVSLPLVSGTWATPLTIPTIAYKEKQNESKKDKATPHRVDEAPRIQAYV